MSFLHPSNRSCHSSTNINFIFLLGVIACTALALIATEASAKSYLVKDQSAYNKAVKQLQPGDNIVLADGVWRDFEIVFEANGTKDAPVTLRAQTPGGVVISGKSNLKIGGNHLLISGLLFKEGYSPSKTVISFRSSSKTVANHARLVETVIEDFSKPDRTVVDNWVQLYGKNNRVDHNYFAGKTNKGPTLIVRLTTAASQENKHIIDHNFFGYRPPLGGNGGETMRIGVSQTSRKRSETVVTRNYFERCEGEVEIISVKSEYNTITGNVFYESRGSVVFRHGGHNVVSRNVFFGNGIKDTGGVRVINDNQSVSGNYFEGLRGQKFMGAITVMNGVPNSPENRYHQVDNAVISNNSFVDISHMGFGVGSDEERSAAPVNSKFQQNLIISDYSKPIDTFDDVSGIVFKGNVSNNEALEEYGSKVVSDIKLVRAENGLLYPEDETIKVGAPRDLDPVKRDATGPRWYKKQSQEAVDKRVVRVKKGAAALVEAVENSRAGDELILTSKKYVLDAPLVISHKVSISGLPGRKASLTGNGTHLFEMVAGGDLTLSGLRLKPSSGNETIIQARGEIYRGAYGLQLNNVDIKGSSKGNAVSFLRADPATFAKEIVFNSVNVSKWAGSIISLSGEGLEGWYLTDDIKIMDSSFKDVGGSLIVFGREGRDESTFGPRVALTNSRLDDVAANSVAIDLDGIDGIIIKDNEFDDTGQVNVRKRVLGLTFEFHDNKFEDTPEPTIVGVNGEAISKTMLGAAQ